MGKIQELLVTIAVIQAVLTIVAIIVVPLFLMRVIDKRYGSLERVGRTISNIFSGFREDDKEQVSDILTSVTNIGAAAENLNAILSDEEALDAAFSEIAARAFRMFKSHLMGVASGDSKRMAKADSLVNRGIVQAAKQLNPAIGLLLKFSGLDEVLEEDPEMIDSILAVISQKGGLMGMFNAESLAFPAGTQETQSSQTGIEF